MSEPFVDPILKQGAKATLEAASLLMHLGPPDAQDFQQEALGKQVTAEAGLGALPSLGGKRHSTPIGLHQAVASEAAEGGAGIGARDREEIGQRGRDGLLPFTTQDENCF
jgi:hypothetical protein